MTTLILLVFVLKALSQNSDSLIHYGIFSYPTKDELKNNVFDMGDVSVTPIQTATIDTNYTNINDLRWVQKIAKKYKVILIGETHYSSYIQNISSRILFAVNQVDYYPLIVLEEEYSKTPFVDYFLTIYDNDKANKYYKTVLRKYTDTRGDSILFQEIRIWNNTHKGKPIEVGFNDLEWGMIRTENILKHYFEKLNIGQYKIDSVFKSYLSSDFFTSIKPLMKEAQRRNLTGNYPFIKPQYIQNVLTNLRYTFYYYNYGIEYYRQKDLIRNLTSDKVFGKIFKNHKVIVYGGGHHMPTCFSYPVGGNFMTEGTYLNYDFISTKGKTYSIMINGLAFELGDMCNQPINKVHYGDQYMDIFGRMKKAYDAGLLRKNVPYFATDSTNEFKNLIIYKGYQNNNAALLVNSINWQHIIKECSSREYLLQVVQEEKNTIGFYNSYIFLPYSPLQVIRAKKL